MVYDRGRPRPPCSCAFPIAGLPVTIVVDRQGSVAAAYLGAVTYLDIKPVVDEAGRRAVRRVSRTPSTDGPLLLAAGAAAVGRRVGVPLRRACLPWYPRLPDLRHRRVRHRAGPAAAGHGRCGAVRARLHRDLSSPPGALSRRASRHPRSPATTSPSRRIGGAVNHRHGPGPLLGLPADPGSRVPDASGGRGPGSGRCAAGLGAGFGLAWTPCLTPTVGAVYTLGRHPEQPPAAAPPARPRVTCLGLGVPFPASSRPASAGSRPRWGSSARHKPGHQPARGSILIRHGRPARPPAVLGPLDERTAAPPSDRPTGRRGRDCDIR